MAFWRLRSRVPDGELERRIRDKLHMLVRYPDVIAVNANRGCVTLEGPVLADEVEYTLRILRRTDGVRRIEDRLAVYEEPDAVPELKPLLRHAPGPVRPAERSSPSIRLDTGSGGAGAVDTADLIGAGMAVVGAVLLAKGFTKTERIRLLQLRKKAQRIADELTRGRRAGPAAAAQMPGKKEDAMPHIKDVMTPQVETISPDATVEDAAGRMKQLDIGVIPVCDAQGLVGMLTDRDLVVRVLGEHRDPKAVRVGEVMTPDITYGFEDQDVREAAMLMADKQIRRLPVLNRKRELVGIVSLGDIAVHGQDQGLSGEVLEDVSQPSQPRR